jgi:hypothetical protein
LLADHVDVDWWQFWQLLTTPLWTAVLGFWVAPRLFAAWQVSQDVPTV